MRKAFAGRQAAKAADKADAKKTNKDADAKKAHKDADAKKTPKGDKAQKAEKRDGGNKTEKKEVGKFAEQAKKAVCPTKNANKRVKAEQAKPVSPMSPIDDEDLDSYDSYNYLYEPVEAFEAPKGVAQVVPPTKRVAAKKAATATADALKASRGAQILALRARISTLQQFAADLDFDDL